jgi:hypothetical protein
VFSAPVVSVSMSVVQRGAKNLRVETDFGGSSTGSDVATGLVELLVVCEVLLEMCLLRLFTSGKPFVLGL